MIADAQGRAIGFALAPGQAHELPLAPLLLTMLTIIPLWIVADRGYASHAFRELIWNLGARPAIPPRRNEASVACRPWIYHNRSRVEALWVRLPVGQTEGVAGRGDALREDRPILHGCTLHGSNHGLARSMSKNSGTKRP